MADLSAIVDTDNLSGDYPSFSAGNSAEAQDLTDGGGDTFTIYNQATTGVADSAAVALGGWVLSAVNDLTITYGAGNQALKTGIDTNRYRLTATVTIVEDYVNFIGIQAVVSGTTNAFFSGSNGNLFFDSCYVELSGSGTGYFLLAGSTIVNCVAYCATPVSGSEGFYTGGTSLVYNCNSRGFDRGFRETGGATNAVNCASLDNNDDFNGSFNLINYCISDDGDGSNPQTPSGANWNLEYLDPSNGDMTPLTGGNVENNGVGPSVDGNVPTPDMSGNPRTSSTCDIGANEIVSGGTIYDMSATGEIDFEGNAVITNIGAMSSTGEIAVAGIADLQRLISLSATGEIAIEGNADIVALIGLSADGEIRVQGSAALAGIFGLSGTGEIGIQGQSVLNAIKILQAAGQLGIQGSADLTFVVLQDGTLSRIFGEIDLFKINGAADLLTISGAADKLEIGGEVDY